jgi:DNA-binding transcriptional ArsR family regulator
LYFDIIRNMETKAQNDNVAVHADRMAALGNEARLTIVRMLLQALPGELSAGDIAQQTGIPNSTLSHHLERLRKEGLVSSRKDKQWVWYRADTDTLTNLVSFLYHDCCKGCGISL